MNCRIKSDRAGVFGCPMDILWRLIITTILKNGRNDCEFVQDNQSASKKGVLRGLHFQINYPQDKLVRVVNGEVFDVAVDLREGSETFGKWFGVTLSAENKKQFFIPKGFAHGFIVLSDLCRILL